MKESVQILLHRVETGAVLSLSVFLGQTLQWRMYGFATSFNASLEAKEQLLELVYLLRRGHSLYKGSGGLLDLRKELTEAFNRLGLSSDAKQYPCIEEVQRKENNAWSTGV